MPVKPPFFIDCQIVVLYAGVSTIGVILFDCELVLVDNVCYSKCGHRIRAITSAFQADDAGSSPAVRSIMPGDPLVV